LRLTAATVLGQAAAVTLVVWSRSAFLLLVSFFVPCFRPGPREARWF
jgi:hypothetical protein